MQQYKINLMLTDVIHSSIDDTMVLKASLRSPVIKPNVLGLSFITYNDLYRNQKCE